MFLLHDLILTDAWLIRRLEKACQMFQRLTGKSNFWLYGQCRMLLAAMILLDLALACVGVKTDIDPKNGFTWVFWGLVILSLSHEGLSGWKQREEEVMRHIEKGFLNPAKVSPFRFFFRIGLGMITLLSLPFDFTRPSYLGLALDIIFPLTLYLEACDPLPPGHDRIRLRIPKLFRTPVPVPAEG